MKPVGEIKENSPIPVSKQQEQSIALKTPPNTHNNKLQNNINTKNNNIVAKSNSMNGHQHQNGLSASKSSSKASSELPTYIQLPTRNKTTTLSNNNVCSNGANTNNISKTALPPHIALPEKNPQKILAQHQTNVAKSRLLRGDIHLHHSSKGLPSQNPATTLSISRKPQIIQIQAPRHRGRI